MYSGILTPDNLAQVLKNLSQRRLSGVLEINTESISLKILFSQGRIVEAVENDVSPVEEVIKVLEIAELITSNRAAKYANYSELVAASSQLCIDGAGLELEIFQRVIKHRLLTKLFVLPKLNAASFSFSQQGIDYDRNLLTPFSGAQVLMDLAELEPTTVAWRGLFEGHDFIIRTAQKFETPGSLEEAIVYDTIGEGVGLAQLLRKTMLCSLYLERALLELHRRELISLTTVQAFSENVAKNAQKPRPARTSKPQQRPVVKEKLPDVVHRATPQDDQLAKAIVLFIILAIGLPLLFWKGTLLVFLD